MPEAEHPAFDSFVRTVAKLRDPDEGCPWNCAQTHASIGDYMIEEAYEALDAIQADDAGHLREELGDVLLQVVLQSQIAADAGEFTIDDVCAGIDGKMVRRHPHVFGDEHAENSNEVAELWEQVKLAEKPAGGNAREGLLDAVPTHFPALLQCQKISRKAAAAGFEWDTVDDVWDKVAEERAELEAAYAVAPKTPDGKVLREGEQDESRSGSATDESRSGSATDESRSGSATDESRSGSATHPAAVSEVEMEFGDLLFALVNVARKMGIDAESALRASNAKFRRRFAEIEKAAWEQGREVADLTLDEMEQAWQAAKGKLDNE